MSRILTKLYHFWIWFWYSDVTRIFLVLMPSYLLVVIPALYWMGITDHAVLKQVALVLYIAVILLAIEFNDYTNLEKIGRDVNRKKLKK